MRRVAGRPSSTASVFLPLASIAVEVAVVVDGDDRRRVQTDQHGDDQRGRRQRQRLQVIAAADGDESEKDEDERFAERAVGDRRRPAGIGPAGRERGEADDDDRPAAVGDQIDAAQEGEREGQPGAEPTIAGLSQPSAVARFGPRRPGASVPRRKSPTSLNRLVPIWMKAAPSAAASSGSHRMRPAVVPRDGRADQHRRQRHRQGFRAAGEEPGLRTAWRHGQARPPQIIRLATKWRAGGKRSRASRPRPRATLSGPKSLEKARTMPSVNSAPPLRSRRRRAA